MKIIPCVQGDGTWLTARLGRPTASEFDSLVSPFWKVRTGDAVMTYVYTKICEKVMGVPLQDGGSWAMGQGSILEHEAIPWFEFTHDMAVQRVGFVTTDDGRAGCSPDGLIGEDGGIEAKCPQPAQHLKYLMEGIVPKEYLAQVHGSIYVTGRKWWKFVSYSRQFPALVVHVEREEWIQDAIHAALEGFYAKFDPYLVRITTMRDAENAVKNAAYEKANP